LSLQYTDGAFNYTNYIRSNPGYMTATAIPALLGRTYPIYPMVSEAVFESPTATETETITPTPSPSSSPTASPEPTAAATPATPGFGGIFAFVILFIWSRINEKKR